MAEIIGNCVIWIVCAVAVAGAASAVLWAIDHTLIRLACLYRFADWGFRNRPWSSAVTAHGIQFWKWPRYVEETRGMVRERDDLKRRVRQLECELSEALGASGSEGEGVGFE